ncbi:MAG: amino acid kinase family protein, partial [Desulforhopalus sp.]
IRKGENGTIEQQFENLKLPVQQIARLATDYSVIITHGNGPQVGNLMLQQECCNLVPSLPLEILVAQTQGQLGYMIESTLDSELRRSGTHCRQKLVSLISYVVVDEKDPAFATPTKPVGPCFSRKDALQLSYPVKETEHGFRRLVASPKPITIVEKREIKTLVKMGFIVICCGGGGIPVTRVGRMFHGVDAVIDKDLASATLAEEIGADIFLIATDVPGAALLPEVQHHGHDFRHHHWKQAREEYRE